jgi:hypothetical protein
MPPRFSFNTDLASSVNVPLLPQTLMSGNNAPGLRVQFATYNFTLKAHPLYTRSRGWKNLGPTLSILGLVVWSRVINKLLEHWHQDINKCWNIGPNSCKKLGFRKSIVSIKFPALGPKQGRKVQHLLVTWGADWNFLIFFVFFFYFSLVTTSVK